MKQLTRQRGRWLFNCFMCGARMYYHVNIPELPNKICNTCVVDDTHEPATEGEDFVWTEESDG